MRMACVLVLAFALASPLCACAQQPLRALVFSGRNNHDWKTTTPALREVLEHSGRFTVDVTNDPAAQTTDTLARYDVIIDNWAAFPEMTGRQWGQDTENAVLDFVRNGGGFVVIHAATACFEDWPEFIRLAGAAWRDTAGHGRIRPQHVTVVDHEHPVTRGMADFTTVPDELYHGLTRVPEAHVLCSVYSGSGDGGTGRYEPVAMATPYGEGRSFHLVLGHDAAALRDPGTGALLARGAEWAATGEVTLRVPEPLAVTPSKTRVAVVTGGHGFKKEAFEGIFNKDPTIEYKMVEDESFDDVSGWDYDALVLYNFKRKMPEERRANFLALLERGTGLVVLHHAIAAYPDWPTYWDIVGARYFLADAVMDGVEYKRCTYKHDVQMPVRVVNPAHPVTANLADFVIHDETYKGYLCMPGSTVLLTCDHAESARDIAWSRTFSNARVVFIQLGHGPEAHANPSYQQLVANAIDYVASGANASTVAEVPGLLDRIADYEPGDSRAALYRLADIVQRHGSTPAARAGLETDLLRFLEEDAGTEAKSYVCRQLSLVASEQSLPILSDLLRDSALSHMARYVLLRMPGDAAEDILIDALDDAEPPIRAGLIQTLGERRSPRAVEELARILESPRAEEVNAAAWALGKTATPEAAAALRSHYAAAQPPLRQAFGEACIEAANSMRRSGDSDEAAAICAMVYEKADPAPLRAAAFLGLCRAEGPPAADRVVAALKSGSPDLQGAALTLVREVEGPEATRRFADPATTLPPPMHAALLIALKERGDPLARPAAAGALANEDAGVRQAACAALETLGIEKDVPALLEAASEGEAHVAEAAQRALARMPGAPVSNALAAQLESKNPAVSGQAALALASRRADSAAPMLMKAAASRQDSGRLEALQALTLLGNVEQVEPLLDLLGADLTDAHREAAETALAHCAARSAGPAAVTRIADVASDAEGTLQTSLVRALGQTGSETAMEALLGSEASFGPEAQEAFIRALAEWPEPHPPAIARLLELASDAPETRQRILALRGAVRLLGLPSERGPSETLRLYASALETSPAPDEMKAIIAGLANVHEPGTLTLLTPHLGSENTSTETARAMMKVVDAIAAQHPAEARAALGELAAKAPSGEIQQEAEALRQTLRLRQLAPSNIAPQGKASSPGGIDSDGGAGGDAAAIDGKPETYWDEEDGNAVYRLKVAFPEPREVAAISIQGYEHHNYAPKDFQILCDGKQVKAVSNAVYVNNLLFVEFPATECSSLELKITAYYGASPAIRELGVYPPAEGARQ